MSHQVLLIDSQPIIHVGVRQIVAGTEFVVADIATNCAQALQRVQSGQYDLAVSDFQLCDGDTIAVFEAASDARIPLLVFTGFDNPLYMSRAIEAGALGIVFKSAPPGEFIEALRQVSQRKRIWNRKELRRVTGALATERLESDIELPLTQREFQILVGVGRGFTNKRIAEELKISYETVKEHVQHILRKLGVSDRTQAAVLAVRKGVI